MSKKPGLTTWIIKLDGTHELLQKQGAAEHAGEAGQLEQDSRAHGSPLSHPQAGPDPSLHIHEHKFDMKTDSWTSKNKCSNLPSTMNAAGHAGEAGQLEQDCHAHGAPLRHPQAGSYQLLHTTVHLSVQSCSQGIDSGRAARSVAMSPTGWPRI